MAQIFLSYQRDDRGKAAEIARLLSDAGYSVFFDVNIDVGDSWDMRIEEEIEKARAVIVVWTPNSRKSKWVRAEAREGVRRRILAPVLLEECMIPLEFTDIQYADLKSWPLTADHPGWAKLMARVHQCVRQDMQPDFARPRVAQERLETHRDPDLEAWRVADELARNGDMSELREFTLSFPNSPFRPAAEALLKAAARERPPPAPRPEPARPSSSRFWDDHFRVLFGKRSPPAGPAPPPPPRPPAPPTPAPPEVATQSPPPDAGDVALAQLILSGLTAQTLKPLAPEDYEACAARLGVEVEALTAIVQVESNGRGFSADGRPVILFEPHIFSRLTKRAYDQSHPNISYEKWDSRRYPRTQTERYAQLEQALVLDVEAAIGATSWGMFQMMGLTHAKMFFPTARAFAEFIAQSEEHQLTAFERFLQSQNLVEPLRDKRWADFTNTYNGPGQVERYGGLLAQAYAREKSRP